MKISQIERTRELLTELQVSTGLTQKKIAALINLKEPELSKAKNPKSSVLGELSVERRQFIITLLEGLKDENEDVRLSTQSVVIGKNDLREKPSIANRPKVHVDFEQVEMRNTLILGCVLSGILTVILVILFKDQMGYANMTQPIFNEIIPFFFLSAVMIGVYTGWLSASTLKRMNEKKSFKHYFYFTGILFLISVFFAGVKSRDSYLMCGFTGKPCNGLLGEPNFELIGFSAALAIGGLGLVRVILHGNFYSRFKILRCSVFYSVISACVFALFDQIHALSVSLGWIVDKGYLINSGIFKFSFSHPERVPSVWLQVFMSLLITFNLLRYRLLETRESTPTLKVV